MYNFRKETCSTISKEIKWNIVSNYFLGPQNNTFGKNYAPPQVLENIIGFFWKWTGSSYKEKTL